MEHVAINRQAAEARVREDVRLDVGERLTDFAFRLAMRNLTFHGYQQAVLRDSASPLALLARRA